MKQALKEVAEINRMNKAMAETRSYYLKNDYGRAVARKKRELREYCKHKNLKYNEIMKAIERGDCA